MNKLFVECVGIVATRREKTLLVEHKSRGIELPGGHKKKGESDAQACSREGEEETGLEVMQVGERLYTMTRGDTECKIYAAEVAHDAPSCDGLSDVKRAWFGFASELLGTGSSELYPMVCEHLKTKHARVLQAVRKATPGINRLTVGISDIELILDGKRKSLADFSGGQKLALYRAFELPVGTYEVFS